MSRPTRRILFVATLLALTDAVGWGRGPASGPRAVVHDVYVDNVDDYRQLVFYVYRRDRSEPDRSLRVPCLPITPGRPLDLHGPPLSESGDGEGFFVFAVPRDLVLARGGRPDPSWFRGRVARVRAAAEPLIEHPRTSPANGAAVRYSTHYRVAVRDDRLELTLVRDESGPLTPSHPVRIAMTSLMRPPQGLPQASRLERLFQSVNPRTAVFVSISAGVVFALTVHNRRGRGRDGRTP